MTKEEHLARHQLADIFLDTFNFNAHSTASDALWAGLPVITRVGEQFFARCAASIVNAVGLPELITKTDLEYEELSITLAKDKNSLHSITRKLENNRYKTPLFDTKRYTRNIEKAFEEAYSLYQNGRSPQHIWVHDEK